MKRRRLNLLAAAPLLATVGVVVASFGGSDPDSRLAVPLIAVAGILATVFLARLQKDPDHGALLRDLMLLGIGVRLFVFAAVHQSMGPYVFAPDQLTYESWGGQLLAWAVDGAPFPRRLDGSLQLGWPAVNAILFGIFGPARSAPAILNIFLSVWTAVPVFHLTRLLVRGNVAVARWAAAFTLFFPSLVLWSVLNIRDTPTILTIVLVVYFMLRVQNHTDLAGVTGVVVSLGALTVFREYLMSLVGLAGTAGILMGRSRSPVRSLLVGSVMLVAVTFSFQSLGLGRSLTGEPTLERAQLLREDFQLGAGSAYGEQADVSTPAGAVTYLPQGLAYFVLAPFPWEVSSTLQAITLPEVLLWWATFPFVLWGVFLAFRHDLRSFTVPLSVLILVTFAYALIESNVGTAYRHRAQILPLLFVFAALGLRDAWAVMVMNRQRRGLRARRAARAGGTPARLPPHQRSSP